MVESASADVTLLRKRLQRERKARREAEQIAERITRQLYESLSDVRELQEAQRQLTDELERRVEERTGELARANLSLKKQAAELERSNLELQQFAYIASHDLQAPLRAIGGFVQLLRDTYSGRMDEQADTWIAHTVAGVERMQTLIRDLLAYSKIESRGRPFEAIDSREVFDQVIEGLEASIRDSNAQVTCSELPTVAGDRSQLLQLLQNLVGNAIKYHGDQPPRVHVSAEKKGSEWVFSVSDNGIGIDPKHYRRIFEIFRRLHTQQVYPGTGIGLAICRRVVQRHGGRIWVESEPGRGSTFVFSLPERSTT